MSVQAHTAVVKHSRTQGTTRLVALAIANRADEHGIAWGSKKDIGRFCVGWDVSDELAAAGKPPMPPATVQYQLRKLRDIGELVVVGNAEGGRGVFPLYWLRLPGLDGDLDDALQRLSRKGLKIHALSEWVTRNGIPEPDADPGPEKGATDSHLSPDEKGADSSPKRAQPSTPERTTERSTSEEEAKASSSSPPVVPNRQKVGGKPVTEAEMEIADAALRAFNVAAGTRYTLGAHLAKLVRRIREHAELDARQHAGIVQAAFADPWWKDSPGPEVIYGNPAQFERSIERWRRSGGRISDDPRDRIVNRERRKDSTAPETRSPAEVWTAALATFNGHLQPSTRALWIDPLTPVAIRDGVLVCRAPDTQRAWVEKRYLHTLGAAVRAASPLEGIELVPDEQEAPTR